MLGLLVTLWLTVCLVTNPNQCDTIDPMYQQVPELVCQTQGQIGAAQWQEEHPKYTIRAIHFVKGPRYKES